MPKFARNMIWTVVIMILCLSPVLAAPVLAEEPNLLQNGGFERPYVNYPGKENCRIAASWVAYWYEGSKNETVQGYRLAPEYKAAFRSEYPGNRVRNGELSQQYFHSFGNFEGGIYQQVSNVRPGARLRFELWGMAWSCDKESKGNCQGTTSGDPSPMHFKIGIDPTGGTDARSKVIVWGPEQNAYDAWTLFQVEAVAQASKVTCFVYSYPDYRSQDNNIYLDDASLTVVSSASKPLATATPPPATKTLVGNRGGAYARYDLSFANVGRVTLTLKVTPYDTVIARGTGFDVYGPSGLVAQGKLASTLGELRATFDPVPGVNYLVQVYNYLDGVPVSFTLSR